MFNYQTAFVEGEKYNRYVADLLIHFGVPKVKVPEFSESVENPTALEKDIIVDDLVIEVKSRNLYFTDIYSFPYDKILVDTKHGYESKLIKPWAYVFISQKTLNCFALFTATDCLWETKEIYDPQRAVHYEALMASRRQCRPFLELVDLCLEYAADRTN
jgi:hypothetical protein